METLAEMSRIFWILILAEVLFAVPASARFYDMYRADYIKGTFCAVIGGACAADIDFDNSFFQNPASLTAGGSDWDYDYDAIKGDNLEPGMKGQNDVQDSTFMGAIAYSGTNWGVGFSFLKRTTTVSALGTFSDDAAGASAEFRTNTTATLFQFNLPISYKVTNNYHLGMTFTAIYQSIGLYISGQGATDSNTPLQPGPALGISLGGIFRISPDFITGGWLRTPMTYYTQQAISTQSTFTRFDYAEDIALHYPTLLSIGVGWTPWQNKNGLYFDLNFVGATNDGFLLTYDNFAAAGASNRLLRKGSNTVIDPRLGARFPWWAQSNGTISLGTYYENSRWENQPDIWHATGGISYRFPDFKFLVFDGVELMIGADIAKNYGLFFFTYR